MAGIITQRREKTIGSTLLIGTLAVDDDAG
jgi:hypothetical protein